MKNGIEKAINRVRADHGTLNLQINDLKEKIIGYNWTYILEWNHAENMAEGEIQKEAYIRILRILRNEGKSAEFTLAEMIMVFKDRIEQLEDDLMGSSFGCALSKGPWDNSSTSVGSNRLAIIRANVSRWERNYLKKVIHDLETE